MYRAIDDLFLFEQKTEKTKEDKVSLRTRVGVDRGVIEPQQKFRSEEYQTAVFKRLRREFAQFDSPVTIRVVLVENNYDYESSRTALSGLFAKKTLWNIFKSLFSSKAKERAGRQLGEQPNTGCEELDAEIAGIASRNHLESSLAQIEKDLNLARKVNEQEYVEAHDMVDVRTGHPHGILGNNHPVRLAFHREGCLRMYAGHRSPHAGRAHTGARGISLCRLPLHRAAQQESRD